MDYIYCSPMTDDFLTQGSLRKSSVCSELKFYAIKFKELIQSPSSHELQILNPSLVSCCLAVKGTLLL